MTHAIDFRLGEHEDLPPLSEALGRPPGDGTIGTIKAFQTLLDIDQRPESLPLALQIASNALAAAAGGAHLTELAHRDGPALDTASLTQALDAARSALDAPARLRLDGQPDASLAARNAPLERINGAWLQHVMRVATADSDVGCTLACLYAVQTMSYPQDPALRDVPATGALLRAMASVRSSRPQSIAMIASQTAEDALKLPLLLLALAQFPRTFLPELLGLNYAWHLLGAQAVVEDIAISAALGEIPADVHQSLKARRSVMQETSLHAIDQLVAQVDDGDRTDVMARLWQGAELLTQAWQRWLDHGAQTLEADQPNAGDAMIELIRDKAPCAMGYHRDKRLGDTLIDTLLDASQHSAEEVVQRLAHSGYVKAGNPDASSFATRLLDFGGPMSGVFDEKERQVVRRWIESLGSNEESGAPTGTASAAPSSSYPCWTRAGYLEESTHEYGNRPCSPRELYYKIVNIEYFPDVLPVAEQYLVDHLSAALRTLTTGERPIPAMQYSHDTLRDWVFHKHREQIDAYEPLTGEPPVSREAFIASTTSLAPLLLIDGGWLQGASHVNTLHSPVGQRLFKIFYEEIGEGSAALHHANIYRELLQSMGVELPGVADLDFALSDHFDDSAFEVPILWLSLSCFSRHYFPELLGINLAVELAGLGANYMQAHDILKYYGYPTTFVDFHNSTDNASVGHAALSMEAVMAYMDDVAEREGPDNLDRHWHRIWAGMRLTLPNSNDFYWRPTTRGTDAPVDPASTLPPPIFAVDASAHK
ncbi:MAG: iron-containing redox enzyme family protein [Alcanivoracaceae bacterium]